MLNQGMLGWTGAEGMGLAGLGVEMEKKEVPV